MKIKELVIYFIIFFVGIFSVLYYLNKKNSKQYPELIWKTGDILTYEYELNSKNLISEGFIENLPDKENQIKVTSKLLFKVISVDASNVILRGLIKNYKIKNDEISGKDDFDKLPFLLKLKKNGEIEKIEYSVLLKESDKININSILYAFQLSFIKNKLSWSTIEKDKFARYSCRYNMKDNDFDRSNPIFINSIIKINKSNSKIILSNNSSWIRSISSEIAFDVYRDKKVVYKTSSAVLITKIQNDNDEKFWRLTDKTEDIKQSLEKPFQTRIISTKEQKAEDILNRRAEEVDRSVETTLRELHKQNIGFDVLFNSYVGGMFDNNSVKNQYKKQLFNVLVAYLKKNPDDCYKIIDLIKSKKLPEKGSGKLFLLLEKVGHQKAQDLLLSILEKKGEFTRLSQIRAATSLMGIKNISMESFQRLVNVEQSKMLKEKPARNSVLLSIGSFGSVAVNPLIQNEAKEYIKQKVLEITDKNDMHNAVVLDAIGNTHNPELIPELKPFIFESKDEVIKDRAIQALIHMPEEQADPVIAEILQADDIYNIRSAMELLNKREDYNHTKKVNPDINKIILEKLPSTKTSHAVRMEMVKYLSISKDNYKMLEEIADDKEENFMIRKTIYERLPFGGKPKTMRGPRR
jgi:hypothetical protein